MEEVESEREYEGYYYSLGEALTIVVLGSLCGLKNVSQIHQWAESERTREWLKEKFAIERIPCYYWLLSLLKMVKPESLNQCLSRWVRQMLPEEHPCGGRKNRAFHGRKERIPTTAAYHQCAAVRARGDACQQKRRWEKQ